MGILSDWKENWAKEQAEWSDHPLSFWLELADMIVDGRKAIKADQMAPMGRNWSQLHWIDLLNKVYAKATKIEKERGMDIALPLYEICIAEEMNNPELYKKLGKWYKDQRRFGDSARVAKINLRSSWPPGVPAPEIKLSGIKIDKTIRAERPSEFPKAIDDQSAPGTRIPDSKQQKNFQLGIVAIVLLCLVCFCIGVSLNGSGDGEKDYRTAAFIQCMLYVEEALKAPSSADFPGSSNADIREMDNQVFEVRSYVDAQNSFGAMLRTDFYCQVQYIGDPEGDEIEPRNWSLLDLQFSE